MPKYQAYLPAFVLLVGCAFTWNARSQAAVPLAAPLATMPVTVPGYRVQNQVLSAEERQVAGMSDYVARLYWRDTVPAFTTLVTYYTRQTQGQTIHSPKNCLPGAGWEVLTAGTAPIVAEDGSQHVVNRYLLKNGAQSAVVYYWYQGRGRVVANEYRVKWNLLRDAALSGHTEESLVRVVAYLPPETRSSDPSTSKQALAAADSLGSRVASRLLSEVTAALPSR